MVFRLFDRQAAGSHGDLVQRVRYTTGVIAGPAALTVAFRQCGEASAGPERIPDIMCLDLPDTPLRTSPQDHQFARRLQQQAVPLPLVESALLLGFFAPHGPAGRGCPRFRRSLAYFQPVIAELQQQPLPDIPVAGSALRDLFERGLFYRIARSTRPLLIACSHLAWPRREVIVGAKRARLTLALY